MGIYQDCPFEHHSLDEPEGDRDRAVTPDRDIIFPINSGNYLCEHSARRNPGGFFYAYMLA